MLIEPTQKFAWNNRIKPGLASETVPVVLSQANIEDISITPQKSRRMSLIMNKGSGSYNQSLVSQSLPSTTSERRKSNPELIMGGMIVIIFILYMYI